MRARALRVVPSATFLRWLDLPGLSPVRFCFVRFHFAPDSTPHHVGQAAAEARPPVCCLFARCGHAPSASRSTAQTGHQPGTLKIVGFRLEASEMCDDFNFHTRAFRTVIHTSIYTRA